MSFGLLKHFKNNKKEAAATPAEMYVKHLIVGHDLGAVLKLLDLRKNNPSENIKIISPRLLSRQMLVESYEFGVTQIRSSLAVENIYKKHFNARLYPQIKDASFYKDGKFHEFGGRAKSMNLLPGEDFFVSRGYKTEVSSYFDQESWEKLDQLLSEAVEVRILESVEKTTPLDLVDKKEWLLTFRDFSKISCENLYLSQSPKKFLQHLRNKEQVSPEFVDLCTSVKIQPGLAVSWLLNKEFHADEQTLFIPQSMTHEWGHFIVEFEKFNHDRHEQFCHVLFLIHEEESQAEDLASKIKLMKRVLERVFPAIEQAITKEYIRFDEEMFMSEVKDTAMEQLGFDYPTLKFLGQTASLESSLAGEKFLARTLLS